MESRHLTDEHLKLLSIFHYVVGGIDMFIGMFGLGHLAMGLAVVLGGDSFFGSTTPPNQPPHWFGWIFVASGSIWILWGVITGLLAIYAGRCLSRRVKRTFCLVAAGIGCCNMPFGTVLGIFTILVLLKPETIAQFESPPSVSG